MEYSILELGKLIRRGLEEDIGMGDLTTNSIVPSHALSTGTIIAKEQGVLAGLPVAAEVFRTLDPAIRFHPLAADGERIERGTLLAELSGKGRAILTGERLALNFLQRLSGIASLTAMLVELVGAEKPYIIDTRKTTPGLRMLEKYAVRMGGGRNHRFGLYDAVMIKDNHIKYAGSIQQAVTAVRRIVPVTAKIEVEVADLQQLEEALAAKVDIIMLDNMAPEQISEGVRIIDGRALVEASGGVTVDNIIEVAKTGVDQISIGALTHSAKALDISLDLDEVKTVIC